MVTLILRSDVDNVGKKGDVVDVADGFARNFLMAKGLAIKATPGAVAQATGMRRARAVKDARDRESAEQVARVLVTKVIRITGRAGPEGRLFGSVTTADLVAAVQEQAGVTLERKRVHLEEPIKALGNHEVPVRLHPEVEFRLPVEVVPA
ncbi:MAG TPA: 50S ribosomal protein L9 [Actinomycetota bacterium]|nr:50S ribosomal protein L9 [Actinomycetota bacterium]